jgi:hypothetical protein
MAVSSDAPLGADCSEGADPRWTAQGHAALLLFCCDPQQSLVRGKRTSELGNIAQPPSSTADTNSDMLGRVDQAAGVPVLIEVSLSNGVGDQRAGGIGYAAPRQVTVLAASGGVTGHASSARQRSSSALLAKA